MPTAFSTPIEPINSLGGAFSFPLQVIIEESGQTFVEGTPVMIDGTDGGVKAWDGTTIAAGIAGFAREAAANLATTGAGAPSGFSPVLGPGSVVGSYSANANQSLAKIEPPGVPINDGRIGFWTGLGNRFVGTLGNNGVAAATANQYVGGSYGLTKDPVNSYWYVDLNKTGVNAVVTIDAIDPSLAVGTVGGLVWFSVISTSQQIIS